MHVAVADGIGHDLVLDPDVEFVSGEERFDGVGGFVYEWAGCGESAVIGRILRADGVGDFGIVEPGDVVEESGKKRVFFDMEIYGELIAARVEVVFNMSEEAGAYEFVGGGLESVAVHGGV